MVYSRFTLLIYLRVGLLLASLIAITTIFLRTDLFFTQIILVGLIIAQVLELSHFVNRTNRDLSRFLAAVKDGDFSISFSTDDKTQ